MPLAYAVAYAGLVATIQFLKRRLVAAERHQHRMARVDPLTGLQNRRAFDEALHRALADGDRFTVLLADVDSFKQINDRFGHTVRRPRPARARRPRHRRRSAAATAWPASAATSSRSSPRAPAASPPTASPTALREAGERVDAGDGPVSLTVSAAVYPEDGADRFTLMRTVDRQLHAIKDARRDLNA